MERREEGKGRGRERGAGPARLPGRLLEAPGRARAAMALVTLQRSPTPSAASSSASNSEVSRVAPSRKV